MIGRARESDVVAIEALERSGFTDDHWSASHWSEELSRAGSLVLIFRDSLDVVGVACFRCLLEDAELFRIAVKPPRRNQGIGTDLIRAGVCWAVSQGARRLLLEVSEANRPARALYERLGFRQIARRDDYYAGGDAAIVMCLPLEESATCLTGAEVAEG